MSGGLFSGLNACVTGLSSVSSSVNCSSQNISIANAVAGKKRQTFASTLNAGQSVNSFTPSGVRSTIQQYITDVGKAVSSSIGTHMALSGQGFFVTSNLPGGRTVGGNTAFTRNGTFKEDHNGNFTNVVGQYLQVIPTDNQGNPLISNLVSANQLVTASSTGLSGKTQVTTQATIMGSLDARAAINDSTTKPLTIFDSLGIEHTILLQFTKISETLANTGPPPVAASQSWAITAQPSPEVVAYDARYGATTPANGMTIVFGDTGNPISINGANAAAPANNTPALTINWNSTAAPSTIALNFGNIAQSNGLILGSQYEMTKTIIADGRGAGKYLNTTIDGNGILSAVYDNGLTEPYAKVPLAQFADPDQLLEASGGIYIPTTDSGNYTLHYANSGGVGGIASGSYEESMIDTAEEFTSLIVLQQLYQANLKGISAIDDMLKALSRIGG